MRNLLTVGPLALLLGACGGGSGGDDDASTVDGAPGAADAAPGTPDAAPVVDTSGELFDPNVVVRFDLDLPPSSIDALTVDPRTYAPGTLHYNGETVENIGVRLKGEWNFRTLDQKAAFKLKFDAFVPDQRFHELKHMNWNNALEDPSFIAERLVYHVFRAAGVVAPRCNSAKMWVNGQPYGLYVNVETEDKVMIGRWFADDDGNIYEEGGVEFVPGAEPSFDLETNTTLNDRSDLTAFIDAIQSASDDTLLDDLAATLDTGEFLRNCALEAIVNQWDGYGYTHFGPNNFRIYHDPTSGRFSFIPWGMDMSMKSLDGAPYISIYDATGMLLQRCLGSSTCRPIYLQTVSDMTDLFEAQDLTTQAAAWRDQVRPYVQADPRKEIDDGTFEAVAAEVIQFTADRPASVRLELP